MRTFLAIELPKEIKECLGKLEEKLKTTQADVKWVLPGNIHLTLKFLGEVDAERLEKIKVILEEVARAYSPFLMRINSLGAFPKLEYLRVIWVGLDAGDKETKQIAKMLEEKIQKLGIPKEERAFSSHITIGRTRSSTGREKLVQEIRNLGAEFENAVRQISPADAPKSSSIDSR